MLFNVNLQAIADGVDPKAGAVAGDRNLRRVVYKNGDARIDTAQKFTDVNVQVALRADFHPIVRQAPFGPPKRLGFGDGFGPELGSFGGGKVSKGLNGVGFEAGREDEGAVGFARAGVFQEEKCQPWRLFEGFGRERAFATAERRGVGGIAGASAGFGGEREGEEEKEAQAAHSRHYTYIE